MELSLSPDNYIDITEIFKCLNCHLCSECDIQNKNVKKSQKEQRKREMAADVVAILATLK